MWSRSPSAIVEVAGHIDASFFDVDAGRSFREFGCGKQEVIDEALSGSVDRTSLNQCRVRVINGFSQALLIGVLNAVKVIFVEKVVVPVVTSAWHWHNLARPNVRRLRGRAHFQAESAGARRTADIGLLGNWWKKLSEESLEGLNDTAVCEEAPFDEFRRQADRLGMSKVIRPYWDAMSS